MANILNRVTLVLALILSTIPVHAQSDENTKSIEAVFANYVAGLAEGDLARLSSAFSPEGVFVAVAAGKDGKPAMVVSRPLKDVLASWAAHPDPTASGQITGITIQNDNMASIQAELDFGTDRYQDNLLLYKIEGHWVIVAKTTYAGDRPDDATATINKE